ncbi:MAG TPA: hypothetical protein VFZ08_00885 [Terriglobia bacterium]|nr:hypothetical protein [Terriglobia bacterium]
MQKSAKGLLPILTRFQNGLAIILLSLVFFGCAVKHTRRIAKSQVPPPPQVATVRELVGRINSQVKAVNTLTATVDLAPTAGSVYSGVIKQYHDVKGFILVKRPDWIRMQGQAPVVRTDIFDMASNGKRFSLYIPSKQKFYVGPTSLEKPSKNALENLRPQHIVDALLLQTLDTAKGCYFREEAENGPERDYVIVELASCAPGELSLKRKIWFDRSDLEISRVQLYGAHGEYLEDIHYSNYQDFNGVHYPSMIAIHRPVEDYSLAITIQQATFNQPIPASKFTLSKPPNAQLIDLGSPGQAGGSP